LLFVSSGAVGSGVFRARSHQRYPQDTATRQTCAAIGQARLMQAAGNFDITIAQVLLTAGDLGYALTRIRQRHLHRLLMEPRILRHDHQQSDSVAVEELKFGDNDVSSVRVAKLAGPSA
jgi:glutamate 5-kinase